MSLLKWKELAQRKTKLGNKINLVHETIKNKKIDEELDQTGYEQTFKPITKSLSKITPKYKDELGVYEKNPDYTTVYHGQKSISRTRRRKQDLENNDERKKQNFTGECIKAKIQNDSS